MKWHKNWRQILKSYSFIGLAANAAIAISVSGLAVLGVLSPSLAFPVLATAGAVLGILGSVGRFVDQEIEDVKEEDK